MEYAAQNVWMKGEDMLLKKEAIRGHDTRKGRKRGGICCTRGRVGVREEWRFGGGGPGYSD